MAVTYNESKDEYRAYYGNQKKTSYSVEKYGDYAKILAELAMEKKKRVQNYIVIEDNHAVVKLYSKTHGYFDVLIDIEDISKVEEYPWYISPKGRTYYAENNSLGKMHRYLLGLDDPSHLVDHKDQNGLNNQKGNLRIVDDSGNKRNVALKANNSTGYTGVEFDGRRYIATAKDFDGNRLRRHFGIKKYGVEKAFELALSQRKEWEEKYYRV